MAESGADKGSRSIRALEILEAIIGADRPLGGAELTAATGLPKATVHRLCALLEKEGFLAPDVSGKGLTLGHRVRALGLGIMAMGGADAYRHHILTQLSQEIGETCNFNVPAGSHILYVDRVETEWPLRTQLPVGSNVPLHCTASGKLYLSAMPAAKRRKLIETLPLTGLTPKTITDPARLAEEIETIRRTKVGTDNEEFVTGMVACAVAVNDERGRMAAMVAFHAPVIRMSMEVALSHVTALRRAADKISADIQT